ncbi:unnamed protein product [Didymodactylos carnosus]|uniref:Uncharacterized protein n=1 Tax=Didymodactylos carnosus TaxID=1234261 RepID=A0A8S2N5X8_9BILA|nr:unnamed protein product [Didymodactylos carnosus]CAF3982388.1 unnamed protein product [Didymodactylos carnosus]
MKKHLRLFTEARQENHGAVRCFQFQDSQCKRIDRTSDIDDRTRVHGHASIARQNQARQIRYCGPSSTIMSGKPQDKNRILADGKKFSGKGRMTDAQTIKFKIYFAKAIRESKTNLDKLYQKSWAIFKHHYSTDKQPMHDWCDPKWANTFKQHQMVNNLIIIQNPTFHKHT